MFKRRVPYKFNMPRIFRNTALFLFAFFLGTFIVWKSNASYRIESWQLVKGFYEAAGKGDIDWITNNLSDKFKSKNYRVFGKTEPIIGSSQQSPIHFNYSKQIPFWINASEQKAVVTFQEETEAVIEGKKCIHDAQYTYTFEKQGERWLLLSVTQDHNYSFERNSDKSDIFCAFVMSLRVKIEPIPIWFWQR